MYYETKNKNPRETYGFLARLTDKYLMYICIQRVNCCGTDN